MAVAEATDAPPPGECDVAVVGAGIIGLGVARELALRRRGIRVAVLEREPRIARHQTGSSSGVIHAGIYYEPGSLKARLCVEGAAELYRYCGEKGIRAERNGKLIVATRKAELERLDELERRGEANGVEGLRRVDADGLREVEPNVVGIEGLHSPNTGVVDFAEVAAAFAQDLEGAGGSVHTGVEVKALKEAGLGGVGGNGASGAKFRNGRKKAPTAGGAAVIAHSRGETRAGAVVLCAGAWSARLAEAAGAPKDPRIIPFRGAYLRLKPEAADLVRANIYPVPDPDLPFLGAHLTRGIDNEVLIGPTALMVGSLNAYRLRSVSATDLRRTLAWPGTWKLMARHWRAGAAELGHAASRRSLVKDLARFVPGLSATDVVGGPAGIRAQALGRDGSLVDDFVISRTGRALHVRNAPSPAATSSLPLARTIADRAESELGI
jgi:2-hydroxyglutarate dehydrogenase